eukprot:5853233-Lingulodinium_polyedra.AAC.1
MAMSRCRRASSTCSTTRLPPRPAPGGQQALQVWQPQYRRRGTTMAQSSTRSPLPGRPPGLALRMEP